MAGFHSLLWLSSIPLCVCVCVCVCVCTHIHGFPGDSVIKNPPANAGDTGLILGSGRCPGEGNGNPLQYSCLGYLMDRGAWRATVLSVTRVGHDLATKTIHTHTHTHTHTHIISSLSTHLLRLLISISHCK